MNLQNGFFGGQAFLGVQVSAEELISRVDEQHLSKDAKAQQIIARSMQAQNKLVELGSLEGRPLVGRQRQIFHP
jgi:hypothetical protein